MRRGVLVVKLLDFSRRATNIRIAYINPTYR